MAAAPRPAAQEQAVLQASRLYLRLPSEQSPLFGKVRATLNMFPGNVTAVLYFADTGVRRGTQCGLRGDMLQELRALLGQCSCDRTQDCRTKPIWTELDNLIQNYLESVTLAAFLTPHLS